MMEEKILKLALDYGIVAIVVVIFVFFELNLWKERVKEEKEQKCSIVKVIQENTEALIGVREAIDHIKDLVLLTRSSSDGKE